MLQENRGLRASPFMLAALLVFFSCAVGVGAEGADGLYANLSQFISANRQAILQLGATSAPAVVPLAFPCELIENSPKPPTSVHQLRPSDVNVVASLGDSITAAFGAEARNAFQLFNEYRGVSWSGGGVDNYQSVVTMPNILKSFNDKLYGYAVGTGGAKSEQAVFNAAVSGAVARDLPGQAERLVQLVKASTAVDWFEDWKVITLWIGGNDLCAVCNDVETYSAQNYQAHLQTTLDVLQQIPRVFVNLVSIMDITRLHELQMGLCDSFHKTVCPCVQRSDETRALVRNMSSLYQTAVENIAAMGRYQTDTFAVVAQPFFKDTQIPRLPDGNLDRSYFAPDCFHFAGKAHAAAAVGLWNNMLQAQGSKATAWGLNLLPKCPTREQPYLCTATNNCGSSTGVRSLKPTGHEAPAQAMTVEQRTMVGLALVLLVAVPIAIFAYLRYRKRAAAEYTPIPGTDFSITSV